MPADPQEILSVLIGALTTVGADSQAVTDALNHVREVAPAQLPVAEDFIRVWKQLHNPGSAAPAPPPETAPVTTPAPAAGTSWTAQAGTLSIGAIIAALVTSGVLKWDQIGPFLESLYKNPSATGLLVLVAVAGAIGGLINGWLAGTLQIMPGSVTLAGTTHRAAVFGPGTLGVALTGAFGAVVAVWLPVWMHPENTTTTSALLSTVGAALLVGLCGSRVLTGQRDKNVLLALLQQGIENPSNPKLAEAVGKAGSVREAAKLVLGAPVGASSSPGAADVASMEADLRSLFDPAGLNQYFANLRATGKPAVLTRAGGGLELGALSAVRALGSAVPESVQHLRLADVARRDRSTLRNALAGVPGAAALPVEAIWIAAREADAKLARMPETWELRPSLTTA